LKKSTGIPSANILINCTHTLNAPSTMILHGYGLERDLHPTRQRAIIKAVQDANGKLSKDDCRFSSISAKKERGPEQPDAA